MPTTTRKHCLGGQACDPRSFEEAADCLGHHSVRRLPEIADAIHRDYNYLAKAFSPFADQHPLRGDLIVPVTLASADDPLQRNYTLLDFLERQVGRVAFLLPAVTAGAVDPTGVRYATEALVEFTELLRRYGTGMADGRMTAEERDAVLAKKADVIRAICVLTAYVEDITPVPPAPALRAVEPRS